MDPWMSYFRPFLQPVIACIHFKMKQLYFKIKVSSLSRKVYRKNTTQPFKKNYLENFLEFLETFLDPTDPVKKILGPTGAGQTRTENIVPFLTLEYLDYMYNYLTYK